MCEATDEGSMEEVQLAIGRKEGIDIQDPINGDSALMKAIKGGYKEIAQILLDLGININLHNIHGDTALHWACALGYEDVVRELVHRGANMNAKGEYGNTPLHLACSNSHDGVVTLLLMEGARVKIRNEFGNDPMKMCSQHSIKMKVKVVKDGGDPARNKMKEEIAEMLEREKIAKALEQRNKEEEAKKVRALEAQVKAKIDAVVAEEQKIEDEDKARIQAELNELKRIEDERIAVELALKEEKAKAKKATKKGKKKK